MKTLISANNSNNIIKKVVQFYIEAKMKKVSISNDCILLDSSVISLDKFDYYVSVLGDLSGVEYHFNEMCISNRLLLKHTSTTIISATTTCRNVLMKLYPQRKMVIVVSAQSGEYSNIILRFYTLREKEIIITDVDDYEQPMIKMII